MTQAQPVGPRNGRQGIVPSPRRERRASRGGRLLLVGLFILVAVVGATIGLAVSYGAATATAVYQRFTRDLPSVTQVGNRPVFKTSRILDRYGDLMYELFDPDQGKRTVVPLTDLPDELIRAFVAVEDASFYENPGVDPRGILRALWQNLLSGSIVEGGSTITQQLIRNVLLAPEERASGTLQRKLKEAVLAMELSRNYSKDQILEMYLNEIYFGNFSYGIETAAKTYFDKSARQLSLAEAAVLAGLPQAPSLYDPFTNFEATKRRQGDVLDLMVRNRFLERPLADAAKAEPLKFTSPDRAIATRRYPHFANYVRSALEERYGAWDVVSGGLTIYTTLDPQLQDMAEDAVRRHLRDLTSQNATNAALVALDPTNGEILAMVGSPDFNDSAIDGQVNAAIAERQPGSAIKPIVYLSAFMKGYSPATVLVDEPVAFAESSGRVWQPQNFDNRFRGPVTIRRALGNSLNIPAVKTLQYAGLADTISLAKRMGMTSLRDPNYYGLAFTLGGGEVRLLELAGAYGVLANAGNRAPVTPIRKVVGADGRVIFEHKPALERIVDARYAFMVTDVLSDNSARLETFGPNSPLRMANNRPVAAKTGSTDDYRDSWTVGYTPSLVTGVWVGRADNQPMRLVLGSSGAGRIWNTFMERALESWPAEPFPQPPGLVKSAICADTGRAPSEECERTVSDWFLAERSPRAQARVVAIDRLTGKLAGPETPYQDVVFQRFQWSASGQGPFPPTEYSGRAGGPTRPWEVLPTPTMGTAVPSPSGAIPSATPVPRATPIRTPLPAAAANPTAVPGLN